jgi:predicted MFS family arabinose efflux permease
MIIFGMLILAVVCFSIFVVDSVSPWVWGAIFFFSRCGAALVEAMRETYFFKMVDVEDVDYINLFRVIFPLGYLLAPLLGIIILRYYPLNCIFLFLGIVLVAGIYFAARLKDTK